MYVLNLEDFLNKAKAYFGPKASCFSLYREEKLVQFVLYSSEVFYLGLPERPDRGLFFQHEVSSEIRIQQYFGTSLAMVENEQAYVEAAFEVLDRYARLRLPDKFLEAYDAL